MLPFSRDRFTWLAYGTLAYFSYAQAVLGPLSPFLREELDLSYAVVGMHLSVLAGGAALTGLSAPRLIARIGRRRAFWLGGAGLTVGLLLLALGRRAEITLAGSFLMGLLGGVLQVAAQAALVDHHGPQRVIALTEAGIMASFAASLSPLLVGGFERAGIGWRGALAAAMIGWAASLVLRHREPVPEWMPSAQPHSNAARRALPGVFWAYWLVLLLLMAVQWSITLWGANFLTDEAGLSKVTASSLMWVYLASMLAGRVIASRAARVRRGGTLLLLTIGIALAGFPVFWLASSVPLRVAGLCITGLGVANFYPLGIALALGVDPDQSNLASALMAAGVGASMLIVPQVLGALADHTGIQAAFALIMALLPLTWAVTAYANRLASARAA